MRKIVVSGQSVTAARNVTLTLSPGRSKGDAASVVEGRVLPRRTCTATRWAFPSPKFETMHVASTKSGTSRSGCDTSPLIVQLTCGRVHHSRPMVRIAVASATPAPIHAVTDAHPTATEPPT